MSTQPQMSKIRRGGSADERGWIAVGWSPPTSDLDMGATAWPAQRPSRASARPSSDDLQRRCTLARLALRDKPWHPCSAASSVLSSAPRRLCGSPRSGFTLLEVLIAIALILALLASLFGFFFDALNSRARVIELTARHRAAATLVERIEHDLLCGLVGDSRYGAGVAGDEASIRILTRSVPIALAERGADDPAAFHDLQLVEYRFDAARGEIEARRGNAESNGDNAARFHSFGARVFKVQFRYHDGENWRASYDSLESNQLPVAVEVALWYDPWPGEAFPEEDDLFDDLFEADEPARRTFAGAGTFDEEAWAGRADRDLFDAAPPPDRVRVIVIPDAREMAGAVEEGVIE